jgi:hypothetical protein
MDLLNGKVIPAEVLFCAGCPYEVCKEHPHVSKCSFWNISLTRRVMLRVKQKTEDGQEETKPVYTHYRCSACRKYHNKRIKNKGGK